MKDVFLVYDTSCFYEIIILNYFMSFTNCDVVLCSLSGDSIRTKEGYSVNVDMALNQVNMNEIRSFIVPGGNSKLINNENVKFILQQLNKKHVLIAGICAGVDVLDDAGILDGMPSTHSTEENIVKADNIITARANAYVDFAIEVAKALDLFESEEDIQETIDFWKNYKRMQ